MPHSNCWLGTSAMRHKHGVAGGEARGAREKCEMGGADGLVPPVPSAATIRDRVLNVHQGSVLELGTSTLMDIGLLQRSPGSVALSLEAA